MPAWFSARPVSQTIPAPQISSTSEDDATRAPLSHLANESGTKDAHRTRLAASPSPEYKKCSGRNAS